MNLQAVGALLERAGFPVSYHAFPAGEAPGLPYICYLAPYSVNFAADGVAYSTMNHINVELYTQVKDLSAEGRVEAALNGGGIYWEKRETYLEEEKCFQILYEFEV